MVLPEYSGDCFPNWNINLPQYETLTASFNLTKSDAIKLLKDNCLVKLGDYFYEIEDKSPLLNIKLGLINGSIELKLIKRSDK